MCNYFCYGSDLFLFMHIRNETLWKTVPSFSKSHLLMSRNKWFYQDISNFSEFCFAFCWLYHLENTPKLTWNWLKKCTSRFWSKFNFIPILLWDDTSKGGNCDVQYPNQMKALIYN